MDISDITLVVMSSILFLGSAVVIVYVNCPCRRKAPQVETAETAETVEVVQTIIAWK
jgi:hypothetical protein